MPDDTIQTTLIVIAIAVSLQTLLLLALAVAGVVAWRRAQQEVGVRYAALSARVDDAVVQARRAADAVERVSFRASHVLSQAGQVVSTLGTLAAMPGQIMRAMGDSASSGLLAAWRRGRTRRAA